MDNRTPVVGVFDDVLYLEDTYKLLSGNENPEDSVQLVNAYIDRWIRDMVVLNKARKQLEDKGSIDELVESYRNSLILHNYEEQIVTSMLDTVVDKESIESHFNKHKKDFLLNNDVFEISAIISGTELKDQELLVEFKDESDTVSSRWFYRYDFVEESKLKLILDLTDGNVGLNQIFTRKLNNGDNLYLYTHNRVESGEVAPLKFVEKQIQKLILHKRKIALLARIKDQQYREAIKKKLVKYY